MGIDLAAIQAEMVEKFSGPVYTANAQLDSVKPGYTVWLIQYTRVSDGKRVPAYDGRIQRTNAGVTYSI